MDAKLIYPRKWDKKIVYLKSVITDPNIQVGDFTIYNDFYRNPALFQKNNVLYHYPMNNDKLIIGKYCSIACGAKFMFTSGNHNQKFVIDIVNFPDFSSVNRFLVRKIKIGGGNCIAHRFCVVVFISFI